MSVIAKAATVWQRQWEKLLCGGAALLMLIVLAVSVITALGWLKKDEPRPVREVVAATAFDEDAFGYLSRQAPNALLADDHAFTVKPPADWYKSIPQLPTSPGIAMEDLLAQIRDAIPRGLARATIMRPVEPEPEPEPEPVPIAIRPPRITPPAPKPPHFITYKGIIRTASGQQMALLTIEDGATGDRQSLYVKRGTPIADGNLRVDAFSADAIRCRTRSGITLTVPYGDRKEFR